MKKYRVIIPEEECQVLEFIQEEMPGVAAINSALKKFEPKIVFSWHLSIMLDLEDLIANGMPSQDERKLIDKYGDMLDRDIKGPDLKKPNALFLARITWNKTRELIWRVHDPEIANNYLKKIIKDKSFPRPFDYRMDKDDNWELAEWCLQD